MKSYMTSNHRDEGSVWQWSIQSSLLEGAIDAKPVSNSSVAFLPHINRVDFKLSLLS